MPWWDIDPDEFLSKKPRCKVCVTHPILVRTGMSGPELKCPVCSNSYDLNGAKYVKKPPSKTSLTSEDYEEAWKNIWGGVSV